MKPLSLQDVFAIFEPLIYTFDGTETKNIKQKIATITIDNPCLNCTELNLQFSGILTLATTSATNLNLNFTLFKVNAEPNALTTFTLSHQFANENLTNNSAIKFEFPVDASLISNSSQFQLELTDISSITDSMVELSIKGTIIGLSVPNYG